MTIASKRYVSPSEVKGFDSPKVIGKKQNEEVSQGDLASIYKKVGERIYDWSVQLSRWVSLRSALPSS